MASYSSNIWIIVCFLLSEVHFTASKLVQTKVFRSICWCPDLLHFLVCWKLSQLLTEVIFRWLFKAANRLMLFISSSLHSDTDPLSATCSVSAYQITICNSTVVKASAFSRSFSGSAFIPGTHTITFTDCICGIFIDSNSAESLQPKDHVLP